MPTFVLMLKADLENIASIAVQDPATQRWCVDVQESAGNETRERVYVCSGEEHELAGSKGTANFAMRFAKDSRHECSINVLQVKGVTRSITEDDDGKFVPIVAFECRGIEPTAFHPEDGFLVTTKGGTSFRDVDLSELEWNEYDEKLGESVGVYGVEAKWELHKGK